MKAGRQVFTLCPALCHAVARASRHRNSVSEIPLCTGLIIRPGQPMTNAILTYIKAVLGIGVGDILLRIANELAQESHAL